MTDESTKAIQELTDEVRLLREDKAPPPVRPLPTDTPVNEAAQQIAEEGFRDEGVTLVREGSDGKQEDVRDVIAQRRADAQKLRVEGDDDGAAKAEAEATALATRLAEAQMGAIQADANSGLRELAKGVADQQFYPEAGSQQGSQEGTKETVPPEQRYPQNQLSQLLNDPTTRKGLSDEKVTELRKSIVNSEGRAKATSARDRLANATLEGNREEMLAAGAEWAFHNQQQANVQGQGPPPPTPQVQDNPWRAVRSQGSE